MGTESELHRIAIAPLPAARQGKLFHVARRRPVGTVALVVVVLLAVAAIASPVLAPYDPLVQDYSALLKGPSLAHPLGTDQVGRDLLSRVIYGARISFLVGVVSVGLALVVGTPIGLASGYFRGAIDEVLMRIIDAVAAFPSLILALAIVAVLKPNLTNVMVAVGITSIPLFARLTRSQVLSLRERDFVIAATATGASDLRIMIRHILPNAVSPLIVQATLGLGFAILAEASLGYLGVGVQPPTPTWGSILNQGAPLLERAPWLSIAPGASIFVLVLAFNLVGDALRDELDPRSRKA
jgi:ABC-type dipeptide/oligopeptide/nickel transport system permease subunit